MSTRSSRSGQAPAVTSSSVNDLWNAALPRIRSEVGPRNFDAWIRPLEPASEADGLTLAAPTPAFSASVNRHFVPLLTRVVSEIAGRPCRVQVADVSHPSVAEEPRESSNNRAEPEATFERFVVGESNEVAFDHARSVAMGSFSGPSPLVLYGWVGLGKTHLARAIGHAMRTGASTPPVICEPAAEFVDRLLAEMRGDPGSTSWKRTVNVRALILDDVHFLAGHAATQDALLRVFAVLHERGTPVVLTSDRAPAEIPDIEQRLRNQFEGGVLARICPPDFDLRRGILLRKAADRGIELPEVVATFLAGRVVGSGRTLEGTLTRVNAYAMGRPHKGQPLTCRLAAEALRAFEEPPVVVTPDVIRVMVAQHCGVSARVLAGPRRTRVATLARQLAMYLCRQYCKLPLGEIAQRFGRKDHSTVLHACGVVEQRRSSDPEFHRLVTRIEELIRLRGR